MSIISAALKQISWPGDVVRWIDRHGGLLKSEATEQQLLDVLDRRPIASRIPPSYAERVRELIAAAIVSGDADLLVLDKLRGIPVLTPRDFVRMALG